MKSSKIVLVTGASSGIGQEISKGLCREGYEVILTSRTKKKLIKLNKELTNLGYTSHVIPCDISRAIEVKNLYKKSLEIGFVSSIVNNAGFGKFSRIEKISVKDWDDQINTNLRGSFLVTRQFVKKMIKKKEGKIIFINSVAGKYGYPYSAAYVSSKFGLRGLADSLRNELREHNIKVISIHPGAINTNFWDNIKGDFPKDQMLTSECIATFVLQAIISPDNAVVEEMVIRRTAGDM